MPARDQCSCERPYPEDHPPANGALEASGVALGLIREEDEDEGRRLEDHVEDHKRDPQRPRGSRAHRGHLAAASRRRPPDRRIESRPREGGSTVSAMWCWHPLVGLKL